jgi:hypothetical protein
MNIRRLKRLTAPAAAAILLAATAAAEPLPEGRASVAKLGDDASAVAFFVSRSDGDHVSIVVQSGEGAGVSGPGAHPSVVRFDGVIRPGQTIEVSAPAPSGSAQAVMEITRGPDGIVVSRRQPSALTD